MQITPQIDGSLYIEDPEKTSGFDMGNRFLSSKPMVEGISIRYFLCTERMPGPGFCTSQQIHPH